jgi:orotate phosphoribosyltransferase
VDRDHGGDRDDPGEVEPPGALVARRAEDERVGLRPAVHAAMSTRSGRCGHGRAVGRRVRCPAVPTAREELIGLIRDRAVVHGRVVLSSGREADHYVDLRRITLSAAGAPLVGEVMLELTADLDVDAVGGLTLGADPVAAAMLHQAARRGRALDAFVVRKAGKEHGLQRRIEGPDVRGRRVLAVEDTSTTGGSVLTAVEALQEAGAKVVAVAVIVDRTTGARELVEAAGLPYRAAIASAELGLA